MPRFRGFFLYQRLSITTIIKGYGGDNQTVFYITPRSLYTETIKYTSHIEKGEHPMKKIVSLALALIMVLGICAVASADEWKFTRPVEIVCPFGSGGGVDTALRTLQPELEKALGTSVIVNNQPGSSGVIGYEFMMKAPADGYTFGMVTASHVVNEANGLMSSSVLDACEGVCRLNAEDYVLLAAAKAPYNDLKEMGEYAKSNPLTVACISMGGSDEFALRLLFAELGIELTMVPYSSGSEQLTALLGGFVDMILSSPSECLAFVESGDMKALGIFNQTGSAVMPDVPSCKDLGLDVDFQTIRCMVAKKGTPAEAIEAMEKAIEVAVQSETWQNYMANAGMDPASYLNGEDMMASYASLLEQVKEGKALAEEAAK